MTETGSDLQARLDELEADVEEKIQDVRERVIQVKRETDTKAPADHAHEELEAGLTALESDLGTLQAELERTDTRLEGGFENFQAILESLLDRTEELEGDLRTVGTALGRMRETLDTVARREQRRAQADRLKQIAAANGVRTARCGECNATVDLGLLADPTCPSCGATFQDLEPNPGFFGTSVLETGDRPALEDGTASPRADLDELGEPETTEDAVPEWPDTEAEE